MADRTVAEHLAAVLADVRPLPPVLLPLDEALGLVAAAELACRVDLPGFDNSAMDGYAVHAADLTGASATAPIRLPVVADLAAGDAPDRPIGRGEAARIMTGAMLPDGPDTVVKVEDTDAGMPLVSVLVATPVGTSIRRRGEDLPAGAPVLAAGTMLTARHLGLLAAAGHAEVLVHPRPRVAVVSTGAELIPPGEPVSPGRIHDSNSYLLAAAVEAAGGCAAYRGSIGDHPAEVRDLLDRLAGETDLVITSGGVSMGVHDVVKAVLREQGEVDFVTVAMQPGKPQGFGALRSADGATVPFFGLPGNPVSAFVSFEAFVRPVLRRLMGLEPAVPPTTRVRLAAALRSPAGRMQFARATLAADPSGGCPLATPVSGQGSHFVADLAAADALLLVPAEATLLQPGDEVESIVL